MTEQLHSFFADAEVVAAQMNRPDLATVARDFRAPNRPFSMAVAGVAGAGRDAIADRARGAGIAVRACSPEEASVVLPVAATDRAVAVLPAGEFLTQDVFEWLQAALLARPVGTCAIVFWGAEQLGTSADLNRFATGVERLVGGQCPIFFFGSAGDADAALRERLARDNGAFDAWAAIRSGPAELGRYRAEVLTAALGPAPAEPSTEAPNLRGRNKLRDQVVRSRGQLVEVIDRAFAGLDREIDLAAEARTRDSRLAVREAVSGAAPGARSGRTTRDRVETALQHQSAAWDSQLRETIRLRHREAAQDAESVIAGIPWPAINECLIELGKPAGYPERLNRAFDANTPAVDGVGSAFAPERRANPIEYLRAVVGALAGGVTGIAIGVFIPFVPPLVTAGVGVVGGLVAGSTLDRRTAGEQLGEVAETALTRAIRENADAIRARLRAQTDEVRSKVESEFDRLASTLADRGLTPTAAVTDPGRDLRARIADLHTRLASL